MTSSRYSLSFTTGGLFLQEAPIVARHYLTVRDWQTTRDYARTNNLLQVRTAATATRVSKELISRLQHLSSSEVEYLADCNQRDLGYLLWSAVCRRYQFIHDFAVDVLRERFLTLSYELGHQEFDRFVNTKAVWHPELDALATSTLKKLRSNLFRMCREADLVSENGIIQVALLSSQLAKLLLRDDPAGLIIFPVTDIDIQRWVT